MIEYGVIMLLIEAFLLGFFVKVITGIDDMLTRVPVLASVARSRRCKVAFSLGAVTAVCVATAVAYFFSELIHHVPYYKPIVAGLILVLAAAIYFDVFVHKPRKKAEKKIEKMPRATLEKLTKLFLIGFIASFTTVLDDVIAYMPVFFGNTTEIFFGVSGILAATVAQALLVIFFAERIARIPYKEEIAAGGLVVLAALILLGIL